MSRRVVLVLAVSAIGGLGLLMLPPQVSGAALLSPEGELRTALEAHGFALQPLDETKTAEVTRDGVPAEHARQVAEREFGKAEAIEVYIGSLTVDSYHEGDENTPLVIEDRPVYAVRMLGMSIPSSGPPGAPKTIRTEVIVVVDVVTGEFLIATSFR